MSVGIPISKSDLDIAAGSVARQMFSTADQVTQIKAWLDATPDATLTAAPYGYTAGEVAILKSAFSDLADLISMFNGGSHARTLPYDYRTFSKQLIGILR